MLDGINFIRKNSIFSFLIGMTFFNSFFGLAYITLMPVFAVDILKIGADGQGVLMSAGGVGALLATITPEQMAEQLLAHPENASDLLPWAPDIVAKERALVQRLKGLTHDVEAETKLGEIQCATLVVFGLEDKMVSPKAAGIYRERIPNSNIAIVYDAGHVIVAERPEALINLVSDYVERRETFIVGRRTGIINP